MIKFAKLLFGGSFGYVQAALLFGAVSFAGYHWIKYHNTMEDNKRLESEVFWAELREGFTRSVNASLVESALRRETDDRGQNALQGKIYAQPKTNDCAAAPSVRVALDGVRERRQARDLAADKRLSVQLPRRADSPD